MFDRNGTQVFVVADGVGSLPGSPIAARTATEAVIVAAEAGLLADGEWSAVVDERVCLALDEAGLKGGTTLAFLASTPNGSTVASIGDSEVHTISAVGESHLVNHLDHIPTRPNILLAWVDGRAPYEPHTDSIGDEVEFVCLMSDGVPAALSRCVIADTVRASTITDAARELVLSARSAGALDDLTAIVVKRRSTGELIDPEPWHSADDA